MPVGKTYKLIIAKGEQNKARLVKNTIVITYSNSLDNLNTQKIVKSAIKRALKKEAEQLLPRQLEALAKRHECKFNKVTVRPMKTRWGSCSSSQVIVLNTYLMMIPWQIINYVIIHELAHTKHMNHSKHFWQTVEQMEPNYKKIKKQLKEIQPIVHSYYI